MKISLAFSEEMSLWIKGYLIPNFNGGGVRQFPHQQNFSDTSWESYNEDSVRFHRFKAQSHKTTPPAPIRHLSQVQAVTCVLTNYELDPLLRLQKLVASSGCCLYFWPTGYKLEVPMIPFSGSSNFLDWLTELREAFHLLDHSFTIKEYNSGRAR